MKDADRICHSFCSCCAWRSGAWGFRASSEGFAHVAIAYTWCRCSCWAYYSNTWGRAGECRITCDQLLDSVPHRRAWRIRAVFLPFTQEASS